MEGGFLVLTMAIFTLLAFVVMALISGSKTKQRMADDTATKSTLAADKDSHGKPADV